MNGLALEGDPTIVRAVLAPPPILVERRRPGASRARQHAEAAWIEGHRQLWAARFDELDIVVEELKRKETPDGRKKRR